MSGIDCNYQRKATLKEIREALSASQCHYCGTTTLDLMLRGELLEVCGEEFCSDIATGERVLVPIALCPFCHARNHQDANNRHNPCQITARLSREGLG